jgi:Holliday junction resolvasome RuvABC DNA-binding subunit
MALFSKKPVVPRPVGEIVSGLTAIVAELDDSIASNEANKEETQIERQAEIERHADAILNLGARETNLDNELNKAATVKGNLSALLGLDE